MLALLLGVEIGLLGLLVWQPVITPRLEPRDIRHESGHQYQFIVSRVVPLGYRLHGDTNEAPWRSRLVVLRDGVALGPAHVGHDRIRAEGNGAFSHWGDDELYFSTTGNTDPRSDGHRYSIRAQVTLTERATWLLRVASLVVGLLLVVTTARRLSRLEARVRRWRWSWALVLALEVLVVVLLVRQPTITRRLDPRDIRHEAGHRYHFIVSSVVPYGYRLYGDTNATPWRSSLVVLQDGRPLGPAHVAHDRIQDEGNGAFSHWGDDELHFSTPGHTDPRSDGHRYAVRLALTLTDRARWLLRLAGAGLVAYLMLVVVERFPRARAWGAALRRSRAWWPAVAALELAVLGLLVWRPMITARLEPRDIRHESGHQYQFIVSNLPPPGYRLRGDTNDYSSQSRLVVLRDGRPLGPAHAVHDVIRRDGNGAFSHWGDNELYFSTPGHTDPRSDGHTYALRGELTPSSRLMGGLRATFVALAVYLLWGAARWLRRAEARVSRRMSAGTERAVRRGAAALVSRRLARVALAGLAIVVAAAFFWTPTLEAPIPGDLIVHVWGHTYSTRVPLVAPPGYRVLGDTTERRTRSSLSLVQDGRPLGPAHASHETIRRDGGGAFLHSGDVLYFSTPGHTDPRADGHAYLVRGRAARLPATTALLALVLLAVAVGWLRMSPRWRRRSPVAPRGAPAPATSRVSVLSAPLKILAVVVACAPWAWFGAVGREASRLTAAGRWEFLAGYVLIVAAAVAGLMIVPFLRNRWLRAGLTALLLGAFMTDQIMVAISGQHLNLDMMLTLWRERVEGGRALAAYADTIFSRAMFATLLGAAFVLPPTGRWALGARFALVPVGALAAVIGVMQTTNGRTEAFPLAYAVPAQLAVAQHWGNGRPIERAPIEYVQAIHPAFKKIVMVVDESVRGDYLGINDPRYDNTPALKAASDVVINYGVATSATNCSAGTRLIIRMGLQKHQLPDTRQVWRQLPTIWQYARKAGYKTYQLDAWRLPGGLHSYMDEQEARTIDVILSGNTEPPYARDPAVADMLVDLLRRDEPMFIYVNKQGTHWEYNEGFPPSLSYDPSPLVADLPLDALRRGSVRDYHKAVRWTVDGFFAKLLPALRRHDAVLLYTSDHGQSLYEGGYDLTHCSMSPSLHRGEVRVPLFLITGSPAFAARARAEAQRAFNHASHFEVFPTLLELMGYSPDWVEKVYGPSLLNVPVERKRGFLMGTFDHPTAAWLDAE